MILALRRQLQWRLCVGIINHIKDGKLSSGAGSTPVEPPVLERLEPRILLSGDGLLYDSAPDPLLHSAQPVVQ